VRAWLRDPRFGQARQGLLWGRVGSFGATFVLGFPFFEKLFEQLVRGHALQGGGGLETGLEFRINTEVEADAILLVGRLGKEHVGLGVRARGKLQGRKILLAQGLAVSDKGVLAGSWVISPAHDSVKRA